MSVLGQWLGRSIGAWFGAIDQSAPAPEQTAGFRGVVATRDGGVRRRLRRPAVTELTPAEADVENAGVMVAAGIF